MYQLKDIIFQYRGYHDSNYNFGMAYERDVKVCTSPRNTNSYIGRQNNNIGGKASMTLLTGDGSTKITDRTTCMLCMLGEIVEGNP